LTAIIEGFDNSNAYISCLIKVLQINNKLSSKVCHKVNKYYSDLQCSSTNGDYQSEELLKAIGNGTEITSNICMPIVNCFGNANCENSQFTTVDFANNVFAVKGQNTYFHGSSYLTVVQALYYPYTIVSFPNRQQSESSVSFSFTNLNNYTDLYYCTTVAKMNPKISGHCTSNSTATSIQCYCDYSKQIFMLANLEEPKNNKTQGLVVSIVFSIVGLIILITLSMYIISKVSEYKEKHGNKNPGSSASRLLSE